ncbi:hypothetical protein D9M73_193950 [compost metagenome]
MDSIEQALAQQFVLYLVRRPHGLDRRRLVAGRHGIQDLAQVFRCAVHFDTPSENCVHHRTTIFPRDFSDLGSDKRHMRQFTAAQGRFDVRMRQPMA